MVASGKVALLFIQLQQVIQKLRRCPCLYGVSTLQHRETEKHAKRIDRRTELIELLHESYLLSLFISH
jgi:hypothetical protein